MVRAGGGEPRAWAPTGSIPLAVPVTGAVPVLADAERIAQVVTNYLTNALKYSKEDRPVVVCLEVVKGAGEGRERRERDEDDGSAGAAGKGELGGLGELGELGELARVSVRDEGIGVPLAEQQQGW